MKIKLSVILPDDEALELQQLARTNERSMMAEIRLAVRAHLEAARQHSVKA